MTTPIVEKDIDNATLTVTTEFDAPLEHVWQLFADPRKLEKWWGPPTYPATVHQHEFRPGGKVVYSMTGPEGDTHYGVWNVIAVNAPNSFEVEDAFADESGSPNPELPANVMRYEFTEADGRTRMRTVARYASPEALQQVLEMGMEEGMLQAMSQIDGVLAEIAAA